MRAGLAGAVLLLLAAGCAGPRMAAPKPEADAVAAEALAQKITALERRLEEDRRVQSVYFRLATANAGLCARQAPFLGLAVHALASYDRKLHPAAAALGVTATPSIAYVLDGSPAAAAGFRPGDAILALDGEPARETIADQLQSHLDAAEGAPVRFTIERAGQRLDIAPLGAPACDPFVAIVDAKVPKALEESDALILDRALLQTLRTEEDLALVLAHQLAHATLGHAGAKRRNAALGRAAGTVADALAAKAVGDPSPDETFSRAGAEAGALLYSAAFEAEADYVSLYLLARAGYDSAGAEEVWRRLPPRTALAAHAASPARLAALAPIRAEIAAARAAGRPLEPRRLEPRRKSD